jgi:hypothetical protein
MNVSVTAIHASAARAPEYMREQIRTEAHVERVRDFFADLGVRASEGNGPAKSVEFSPNLKNAEYVPAQAHSHDADHVHIGVDPRSGRSFNEAPDVIAHEWAHRVIDHITKGQMSTSPMSEDVAVHESLADTFAAAYDTSNWTLGEGTGSIIRDMARPERLGHPGHVSDLRGRIKPGGDLMVPVRNARGGVSEAPDWHKMAHLYLDTIRNNFRPGTGIAGLAVGTLHSARDLFGRDSAEFAATRDAWLAVGIFQRGDSALTQS